MSQLGEVHEAVADTLRQYVGGKVNVAAHPYSSMQLPRIEVWPAPDYYDPYGTSDSDEGTVVVNLRLMVMFPVPNGGTALNVMSELLGWGPGSLRHALMDGDRTLGGVVDDVAVSGSVEWDVNEQEGGPPIQVGSVPISVGVQKRNT